MRAGPDTEEDQQQLREDRELADELLALLELQRDLGTPREAQVGSLVAWMRMRDVLRRVPCRAERGEL